MIELTHIDNSGSAQMVDITDKKISKREATAEALVSLNKETLNLILTNNNKKGDVLASARIAGIQAAKKCWELIPLCHPLMLSNIIITLTINKQNPSVSIKATAKLEGKTGAEMEAMTAVSVAALTIYDMCKATDRFITITNIRLLEKSGGKSGYFKANYD